METMDILRELPLRRLSLVALACWLSFVTARTLIKAYSTPLSDVPGPWIAKFTRLWLMRAITKRSWHKINISLHRKYGEFETPISSNEQLSDPGRRANSANLAQ